ncbi:hypothetical protein RHOSPDRAFT_23940 [Rhodotorula sp. JG-1b]|nr:hypothetical protein RHOSPDRAFT_23940 [Rhodotorula sp. JG-1b]
MALAALIAAYPLAGAICLFLWGEFLWFDAYEYQSSVADDYAPTPADLWRDLYRRHAFTNYSIIWTSALAYMLPFVMVISIVRAGANISHLTVEDNVVWECNNDRMPPQSLQIQCSLQHTTPVGYQLRYAPRASERSLPHPQIWISHAVYDGKTSEYPA